MGAASARSVVLDAGALIALERGDRRMTRLLERLRDGGERLIVPAGVLAQVWRDGSRQARLAALVGDYRTEVEPLDRESAKAVGVLCARTGSRDVIDASVVVAARIAAPSAIVTSDADDLRRLDSTLEIIAL